MVKTMASFAKLNSDDLDICSSSILDMVVDNKTGKTSLSGHALDYAENMKSLEIFLEKIPEMEDREMISGLSENRFNKPEKPEQLLRNYVVLCLPQHMSAVRRLPREYLYSEEVEVFLSCCEAHPIEVDDEFRSFCRTPLKYLSISADYENLRSFVNDFMKDLRQRLLDPKIRKKIRDRRSAAQDNYQQAATYVRRQFSTCARLVILRIDFGYKKEFKASIEQINKDLVHFFSNMRHNKLFRHLRGRIVKIEHGTEKGIHVHLMLFFDGSKRNNRADIHHAQKIGDYWVNIITKKRGDYWNSNANKKEYEEKGLLGIGVIHADDHLKVNNVLRILRYLCKKEQFIKPRTNPKMKLLRMGDLPELPSPKLGAPRSSQRNSQQLH